MINLNIKNIIDELFALTALRARQFPGAEIPHILSRDQLPALRILVRSAFSQMVARLISFVADAATDEDNPDPQQPFNPKESVTLMIDFGSYTASLSSGSLLVLRRQLEHLLALLTLSAVYDGGKCSGTDSPGALTAEIDSVYEAVISYLTLDSNSTILAIRQYA